MNLSWPGMETFGLALVGVRRPPTILGVGVKACLDPYVVQGTRSIERER